jgi:hypothetical protein
MTIPRTRASCPSAPTVSWMHQKRPSVAKFSPCQEKKRHDQFPNARAAVRPPAPRRYLLPPFGPAAMIDATGRPQR